MFGLSKKNLFLLIDIRRGDFKRIKILHKNK